MLRELSRTINDDGSHELKAHLSPEQGARIVQALQEVTDAIREEQRGAAAEISAHHDESARAD